MDTMPIAVSAFYTLIDALRARLRIVSENDLALTLTVIHEDYTTVTSQDLDGDEASSLLEIKDKQSITLIGRRTSGIVATGVYEVDCSGPDAAYVLIPRGGYNILLDQQHLDEVQ